MAYCVMKGLFRYAGKKYVTAVTGFTGSQYNRYCKSYNLVFSGALQGHIPLIETLSHLAANLLGGLAVLPVLQQLSAALQVVVDGPRLSSSAREIAIRVARQSRGFQSMLSVLATEVCPMAVSGMFVSLPLPLTSEGVLDASPAGCIAGFNQTINLTRSLSISVWSNASLDSMDFKRLVDLEFDDLTRRSSAETSASSRTSALSCSLLPPNDQRGAKLNQFKAAERIRCFR